MPIYRVDAVLPFVTNLPRDVAVNTFHVEADDMTGDQLNAVHGAIPGFYNNDPGTVAIAYRLTSYITRGTDECYLTIREVGVPGPPLDYFPFTLEAAGANTSLPFEVAVCCSYGSIVPTVPRARSRGRIFLGPLIAGTAVVNATSGQQPYVADDFMEDIGLAAAELHAALSSYNVEWGVYSRVDTELYPIEAGYVDNAFDTQRRREVDATVRVPWVVA